MCDFYLFMAILILFVSWRWIYVTSKSRAINYQSIENAAVAFVKGADERNKFFEKIISCV